jgi:hypothetical protein
MNSYHSSLPFGPRSGICTKNRNNLKVMMGNVETSAGRLQFTCFLSNNTCKHFLSARLIALIRPVSLTLNNFTHKKLRQHVCYAFF